MKALTTGPGKLTLKTGSERSVAVDYAAQVTSAEIDVSAKTGDKIELLDGSTVADATTYEYKLKAEILQNLSAKGIAGYAHEHPGEIIECEFVPNNADGAKFVGNVRIDPPKVGGKVGKSETTTIDWDFIGKPKFTAATKVGGEAP